MVTYCNAHGYILMVTNIRSLLKFEDAVITFLPEPQLLNEL